MFTGTMKFYMIKPYELELSDLVEWLYMRANYNGLPKHPLENKMFTKREVENIFTLYNKLYIKDFKAPIFFRYAPIEIDYYNKSMEDFNKEQLNCYKYYNEIFTEWTRDLASEYRNTILTSTANALPQLPLDLVIGIPKNIEEYKFNGNMNMYQMNKVDFSASPIYYCNECNKKYKTTGVNFNNPNQEIIHMIDNLIYHPSTLKVLKPLTKEEIKKKDNKNLNVDEVYAKLQKLFDYNLTGLLNEDKFRTINKRDFEIAISKHFGNCPLMGACPDLQTYSILVASENDQTIPKSGPICPYLIKGMNKNKFTDKDINDLKYSKNQQLNVDDIYSILKNIKTKDKNDKDKYKDEDEDEDCEDCVNECPQCNIDKIHGTEDCEGHKNCKEESHKNKKILDKKINLKVKQAFKDSINSDDDLEDSIKNYENTIYENDFKQTEIENKYDNATMFQ